MKILVYFTLGALLACPTLANAQSTNAAPSGPPPGGDGEKHHMGFLTADERAELKKDHDAAAAANPDLAKQIEDVHTQMKAAHDNGEKPDASLFEKMKSLHDQMDAAMIKIDPNVEPILAKIKAHHHGPGGPGGGGAGGNTPPPPPDSGT
jgi:hypothetical protein